MSHWLTQQFLGEKKEHSKFWLLYPPDSATIGVCSIFFLLDSTQEKRTLCGVQTVFYTARMGKVVQDVNPEHMFHISHSPYMQSDLNVCMTRGKVTTKILLLYETNDWSHEWHREIKSFSAIRIASLGIFRIDIAILLSLANLGLEYQATYVYGNFRATNLQYTFDPIDKWCHMQK